MKRLKIFPTLFYLLLLFSCSGSQKEFYVMGNGDDNNPGTKEKPFRTILKAIESVREITSSAYASGIVVWIGGGTYNLDETIVMGPSDSGPDKGLVVYCGIPGEKVEFSGGLEVSGWEKRDNGLWVAPIILKGNERNNFRELFIDGKRAIRARHPDNDYLRVVKAGSDRRTNFSYNEKDFPYPGNPSEVELVLLHDWSITRIGLSGIDKVKRVITAKDSIGAKGLDFFNIDNWEKNPRYFLENSITFLDSDDEWYYDNKEGVLYLRLREGETPVNKRVVIPVLANSLLQLIGSAEKKISNVRFENINFSFCSWQLPSAGYAGIQACFFDPRDNNKEWNVVPAAIKGEWCDNCSFVNCNFSHLGGSGVWFGTGSSSCSISGCQFEDISGNGIMIGEGNDRMVDGGLWWKKSPDQAAIGNRIENSTITSCGRQFYGAVGIWCGLSAKTSIVNNQIHNLPYTGISAGWLWNPEPTPCRENRIEGNHIHHIMQVLSDGGGIYMLGLQPGSTIVRNHIHNISLNAGRAESNGMFLDEGTTDVLISENLIYSIAKSPLRFHKATINLVKDNILVCSGDNPPVRYNNTPVENIKLENNQVLQENNPEHQKILKKAIINLGPK